MSMGPTGCATGNIYEGPGWRFTGDETLRPGGLALTDRALAACALPAGARIWDIGCGRGTTVDHLIRHRGLDALGVDSSQALLDAAREAMPWLPLVRASGDALPCASESLDAVLAECSWSAMAGNADPGDGQSPVLAEFRRVLRPRGWLILSDVYARAAARTPATPLGDGCWRTLPTELEVMAAVTRHGFVIELWEDHGRALREFAARMILEHGSLDPLWGAGGDRPASRTALRAAQPSYFLLIARRD